MSCHETVDENRHECVFSKIFLIQQIDMLSNFMELLVQQQVDVIPSNLIGLGVFPCLIT